MALVLYPLAKMPPVWGALTWFYVKVGLTLLAFHWVFRLVETPGRPFPLWARVATVLLSLRPIIGDLHHGNVNLFILFLVVAALAASEVAAICCPAYCSVWPWPARSRGAVHPVFPVETPVARAGRLRGRTAPVLWPGFVPALALGWNENQQQVRSWYVEMVYPFVVEGKVTSEHPTSRSPASSPAWPRTARRSPFRERSR